MLYVIMGPSGSGKTTVADSVSVIMSYKVVKSFTTRKERYPDEPGHIFLSDEDFNKIDNKVAYVEYAGNKYCSSIDQLLQNNIYIAEPSALKDLSKLRDKKVIDFRIIYIDCPPGERVNRMVNRGDSEASIKTRVMADEKYFADVKRISDVTVKNIDYNSCISDVINYIKATERTGSNSPYDIEYINNRVKRFRNSGYSSRDITIYFDMDNVLALFSFVGREPEAVNKMWEKGFFENLECFYGAPEVVKQLIDYGFTVKVLSCCIDSPYCKKEKRIWLRNYFPFLDDESIILISNGQKKSDFMTSDMRKTIIIDDYHKHIIDVYKSGGIGIKKSFSGRSRGIPQIRNLSEIYEILFNTLNIKIK